MEKTTLKALDAPSGNKALINTPWNTIEEAMVVNMPDFSGNKVKYAMIFEPKTNPGVKFSVFKL